MTWLADLRRGERASGDGYRLEHGTMRPDDDPRVRPIPLDVDVDRAAFPSEPTGTPDHPARRGRPIAASAVLAVLLLVVGFAVLGGAGDGSEAEPEIRVAAGSHLGDDADLVLAATAGPSGWSITWTPLPGSQPTGAIGAIPAPTTPSAQSPTTDAGRAWLASPTCDGSRCGLGIAAMDDPTTAIASIPAIGHAWHGAEPNRLAWIEDAGTSTILRTGTIDAVAGLVADPLRVAADDASDVALWDEFGFVIDADRVTALDPTGVPTWSAEGSVLDATPSIVVVEDRDGGWSVLDRVDGSNIMTGSASGSTVAVVRERAGELVSSVTRHGYRHTFTLEDPSPDEEDALRPEFRYLPTGSDVGAEYRLLRSASGDRLTFQLTRPDPMSSSRSVPRMASGSRVTQGTSLVRAPDLERSLNGLGTLDG